MNPNVYQFCKALPKIELHAHLNGSLNVKTLTELGCLNKSLLQYNRRLVNLINNRNPPLDECFGLFQIAHNVTKTPKSVYIAAKGVIEDFADEHVMYLELRTTPRAEETMSKEQYIESIVKAVTENERDIVVKLLLSINRSHDAKTSEESLDIIIDMKKKYPDIIKGVDLSGNPKLGKFDEALFRKAKANGLFTAIHCAEVKNDEEVKEILNFQPDRIGHATFLHPQYSGCEENWQLYCEKKIPTECCITSNVVCETSPSYADHHVREWIKNELPFCICTDDKGVFCTSIAKEYQLLHDYYGLSKEELWKVSLNAVDYAFVTTAEKMILKSKLAGWKMENEELFQ